MWNGRLGRAALVAMLLLGACQFTLDRQLGPGQIRGRLVAPLASGATAAAAGADVALTISSHALTADSQGNFDFTDLSTGLYTVTMTYDPGQTGHPVALGLSQVELPPGDGIDLGTIVLGAAGGLTGVVSLNGAPLPNTALTVLDAGGNVVVGIPTAVSDASGNYSIPYAPAGTVLVQGVFQTTTAQTATSNPVTVVPRTVTTANIDFTNAVNAPLSSIQGSATAEGVTPPVDVTVTLTSGSTSLSFPMEAAVVFAIPDLTAGLYDIAVSAPGLAPVVAQNVVVVGETNVGTFVFVATDPCVNASGGCGANATCTSSPQGEAVCTCNAGYTGDGHTCTAAVPCETNNGGCDVNATCQNEGDGGASCTCKAGFSGDGHTCTAVPCETDNGGCDVNATCQDEADGGALCTCKAGYGGDGLTCTVVLPCETNNGGCDLNAACQNEADGGALCTCNLGFSGNGQTCTFGVMISALQAPPVRFGTGVMLTATFDLNVALPIPDVSAAVTLPNRGPIDMPCETDGTDSSSDLPKYACSFMFLGSELEAGMDATATIAVTVDAGIGGAASASITTTVVNSTPSLSVNQSAIQWIRSPWGSAAPETNSFGTVPAGAYAALAPPDAQGGVAVAEFTASPFTTPQPAVVVCEDTGCTQVIETLAVQSDGNFPMLLITNSTVMSLTVVYVASEDVLGDLSTTTPINNCQWIATPNASTLSNPNTLSGTAYMTPSVTQDPLVTTAATGSFAIGGAGIDTASTLVWRQRTSNGVDAPLVSHHAAAYDAARGVMVVHGGIDGTGNPTSQTMEWDNQNWTVVTPTTPGPAVAHHSMAYDAMRGRTVLFGNITEGTTWEWDGQTWTMMSPAQSPPATDDTALAFDAKEGDVILFGGTDGTNVYGDTWAWDGTDWTLAIAAGTGTPPARSGASLSYDIARGVVVLFGGVGAAGQLLNDTWEYSLSEGGIYFWQQIAGAAPPARSGAVMSYNASQIATVLIGGVGASSKALNDVWQYNGTSWTSSFILGLSPGPVAVAGAAGAYDAALGQSVFIGGTASAPTPTYQVWGTDLTLGYELEPNGLTPPARQQAIMAFDENDRVTEMFGGNDSATGITPDGDTWLWNGFQWTQVSGTGPSARANANMVFDVVGGAAVLFGGEPTTGAEADTWTEAGGVWTAASTGPPARWGAPIAYDVNRHVVVMFGGLSSPGSPLSDLWQLSGMTLAWTEPTQKGALPPTGLQGSAMAYEIWDSAVMMYGGVDSSNAYTPAVWIWNGTKWTTTTIPASGPAPRVNPLMVYAPFETGTRTTMLGGQDPTTQATLNDVWLYTATGWGQYKVATPFAPLAGASIADDDNRQRVVVFGGVDSSGQLSNDIWELDDSVNRSPMILFNVALSAAGVPYSSMSDITVRGYCAGHAPMNAEGVAANGAALSGWDTTQLAWTQLASNTVGTLNATPLVATSPASRFVLQRDLTASFACQPLGSAGTGIAEATVTSSYMEARVSYTNTAP